MTAWLPTLRAAGYEPERRRDHTGRQARSYPLVVRSALDLSDERSAVLAAQWARQ